MCDDRKIKDIYKCKSIEVVGKMYPLQKWYNQLIDKTVSQIDVSDVLRMFRQKEFIDIAMMKAVEYLKEDPFIGEVYDGELLEKLSGMDIDTLMNYINDIKDILSDASEKNDSYEWIDSMERIEFKEVIKQFRDRLDTILVELKYPSAKTINKLTKELKLKETNDYTQDWEFEVANINQLSDYIEYYQSGNLNINEKTTLMRIILEAYNEFLSIENKPDIYGEKIKEFLKRDYSIYHETIEYWACEGEESDNCFVLTPFIRNIKMTQKQ